jgi:hypothetical protein
MSTTEGIRTITEKSIGAWFTTNADMLPGVQIALGQTSTSRGLPTVIIHAETASAATDLGAFWQGNFEVTVKVYVYSSADDDDTKFDALEAHRERVLAVYTILSDVEGLKSAWTQGQMYQSWIVSDDEGVEGRRYGNLITYTLFAVYPPA